MTGVTSLRMLARLAALVSTLVCAATTVATAPSAGADPCPDIEVIFARGTNDAPGLGRPGQAFADALSGQIGGRSMTAYGVNYPASYDFLAAADGATDAANRISALAASCPSTRIVLGGYSQGAAVVVFGNPATKFGNPVTASVFGGKAIDLCKDGDPICSRGRNPFAHSDYVTAGLTDQAASFVAGIV